MWWPWQTKQVETKTAAATSEPPEWFVNLYNDYLNSEEGRRLYGRKTPAADEPK